MAKVKTVIIIKQGDAVPSGAVFLKSVKFRDGFKTIAGKTVGRWTEVRSFIMHHYYEIEIERDSNEVF